MVVAALGGEGGGVFTNWLIEVAAREDWWCQTTSLAGVAQRTGATIYYLELFPRADAQERPPVMSLFPAQGDIDIAVASEAAEAGRMVQRGFVTPQRTTLIASEHRVYGISEKSDLADGRVDPAVLQSVAARYARNFIHYDMQALAEQHGAVLSAVLLGAVAGAGVLPFSRASYAAAITATDKAVATNLAAFEASYRQSCQQSSGTAAVQQFTPPVGATDAVVTGATVAADVTIGTVDNAAVAADIADDTTNADNTAAAIFTVPAARTARGAELLRGLQAFPAGCQEVLYHALQKLLDYQDYAYAGQYLTEMRAVLALDGGAADYQLTRETARYLALWMCFEDIPRVAQFKTRAARMDTVRREVRAAPGQLFAVTEFFSPRVEEIAALLPPRWGAWVLGSTAGRRCLKLFTGGRQLRTNTLTVYLALRLLAGLRRWRRAGLGYQREHAMIARWLRALKAAASTDQALAREVAECGRLVKGYGATRHRTSSQLMALLEQLEQHKATRAKALSQLRRAALQDDTGSALTAALARTGTPKLRQ